MSPNVRTVVLRITEPQPADGGAPYPVALVLDPDGASRTLAEHKIPRALATELGSSRTTVVEAEEVAPATVSAIGGALHRALGPAAAAWSSRAWRKHTGADPVRILLDVRPEALAPLPWELLMDPDHAVYHFGRPDEPVARITSEFLAGAKPPEREHWPLRILVVIGTHDSKINALEERELIDDALVRLCADIDLEVIERPTREKLLEALKNPQRQILHFIGHGTVDAAGLGALSFEPKNSDAWDWPVGDIRMDLKQLEHKPRLVVLNACRSGDQQSHRGTLSVARGVLGEEVPAVIAMQGPIDGAAAARFSKALYTALADGEPLDVAVVRGREGIAAPQDVSWSSRETWLPTLTLGVPPECVLPPRYVVQSIRAVQIRKLVKPLGPFVDRRDDRRILLSQLEAEDGAGAGDPERLLLVTGEPKAGKTVLVKWAVAQLAYRDEAAVYVSLASAKSRPRFLEVMERIESAMRATLWAAEKTTPLDDFAERLQGLKAQGAAQPSRAAQAETCVMLVKALERASETSRLVIALDQIEAVFQQDYAEILSQKLLRPVAEGAAGDTVVILVHHGATATGFDEVKPTRLVTLQGIQPSQVKPYLRQYILYHGGANRGLVDAILAAVDQDDSSWLPDRFPKLMLGFGMQPDPQALI